MNGFRTPDPKMAGFITAVLLLLFAFSYLAPALDIWWIRKDVQFDPALQQNMLLLLTLAVGYYIGSSRESAEKNTTIATQANAAAAVVAATAPVAGAIGSSPAGTPDDPVSVTDAPAPVDFDPTQPPKP